MLELEDKNILITGASSGIGRRCAVVCNKNGARVHLLGRNTTALNELVDHLNGDRNSSHYVDMRETDKFLNAIDAVVSKYGKIDGFVHSAGYQIIAPVSAMGMDQYLDNYLVNVVSAFELVRILSRKKVTSENGLSVVFISSVMSVVANKGLTSYCATKAALVGGAKAMAVEFAGKGIRVNCVSPGTVSDTNMTENLRDQLSEQEFAAIKGEYPMGLGSTDDVAQLCVYLLSDKAKWMTGQNLVIDGGYSIK